MRTFHQWLTENAMSEAAGYLIGSKVFCPECAESPLSVPPDAIPLTPSEVKKALLGSRPQADRATARSSTKAGGPSCKCNGRCERRFSEQGRWITHFELPEHERPRLVDCAYGEACPDCILQMEKKNRYANPGDRNALFGDRCDTCNRLSTGWEWVELDCASPDDCEAKLKNLGF